MSQRLLSIDIFRGLTIFTMVFVNDLASVQDIPAWMKHAGAHEDTMTFVDVVFPAFLFIVGMAIPLSMKARGAKGQSFLEIGKHILIRTFGLLVLGVFMVNSDEMNEEATLIPAGLWKVSFYVSAILIWNQYPKVERNKQLLFRALQIMGIICLLLLIPLFRKGDAGITGMTPSWWGILGLIGWAYLISTIVYMVFKDNLTALVGILGIFILLCMGLRSETLVLPTGLGWLKGQAGNIAHASLCLAGMILSLLLMENSPADTPRKRIQWMVVIGIIFLIGGYFTRPFFGISKILATPSWVLYCAAICCFLFPLIYWLVDVKNYHKWANFLTPAGKNPLLTYILPPIIYAITGYLYAPELFNSGMLGIIRALLFSFFVLGVAGILTKWRIRLHL